MTIYVENAHLRSCDNAIPKSNPNANHNHEKTIQ